MAGPAAAAAAALGYAANNRSMPLIAPRPGARGMTDTGVPYVATGPSSYGAGGSGYRASPAGTSPESHGGLAGSSPPLSGRHPLMRHSSGRHVAFARGAAPPAPTGKGFTRSRTFRCAGVCLGD